METGYNRKAYVTNSQRIKKWIFTAKTFQHWHFYTLNGFLTVKSLDFMGVLHFFHTLFNSFAPFFV